LFFTVCISAPIIEEIILRGFILQAAIKWNVQEAMIVSSSIFWNFAMVLLSFLSQ